MKKIDNKIIYGFLGGVVVTALSQTKSIRKGAVKAAVGAKKIKDIVDESIQNFKEDVDDIYEEEKEIHLYEKEEEEEIVENEEA